MKIRRASSKSGLFLTELLIVIAFFAFASAWCLQMFAEAHNISTEGRDLSRAVTVAQSAAEGFKATGGSAEELARLLNGDVGGDGRVTVCYDKDWAEADSSGKDGFYLQVRIDSSGQMRKADIQVCSESADGAAIYSLQASHFVSGQ